MRTRMSAGVVLAMTAAHAAVLLAAGPPTRKPLGPGERDAVLALIKTVDLAQAADTASDPSLALDHHVLRSGNYTGYIRLR